MVEARSWLLDGERVLWEGAPPRGLLLHRHDAELIPFAVGWAGFAAFWNVSVWHYPNTLGAWMMRIWGAPFLVMGLYITIGRVLVDAWVRRRQRCFVTDRRVLVVRSGWRGGVIAADLDLLPFVTSTRRRAGSGDIRFSPPRLRRSAKGRMVERDRLVPSLNPNPQCLGVPDVSAVDALIERAVRVARASTPR